MNFARSFGLGFLAVALIWTSMAMALARTTAEGRTIVICSGGDAAMVTLGADGMPVDAAPICADCIMSMTVLPCHVADWERPLVLLSTAAGALRDRVARPMPRVEAAARGPPATV